ncbi:MAG: HobA family DNA replication regulator [Campylobacterota bacterium]|nr:HobA family DNA replication regulator [Campylobacterota bacterium]
MQEFTNWTINTIREDKLLGSWLEEKKYEWTPLVAKSISNLLDKDCTVIVITDEDREWFLEYIMSNINQSKNNRPYLPFYDFRALGKKLSNIQSDEDIALVSDMLNISFPNGYCFWYIGKSQNKLATIAKVHKKSFLWLLDEEVQNSFYLQSSDEALEMKLLQMYRLYNKTLSAALFAQIDVHL